MDPRLRAQNDVDQQLERIARELAVSSPELYRQLALYLQVLRQGLLASVQQACFTLATRHADEPYGQLPFQQRRELHSRIGTLVQRCTSLLTVEQLTILGGQLERQQRRARQRQHHTLLESFAPSQNPSPDAEPEAAPAHAGHGPAVEGEALPPGSVRLDLAPPVGADLFTNGLPTHPSPTEFGALIAMALERQEDPEPGPFTTLLPEDPPALMAWMDRFEQALQRRLRNLSHAVNMELLRIGLLRHLLPVHLLDAVLAGQIDPQPAPANLLRLPLPLERAEKGAPLELNGLLLRCSDLEYEQPRLRTCRLRLRDQQQTLRRMAQHYRHWQRRAQVLEAEQLWLQDTGAIGPTPPPAD